MTLQTRGLQTLEQIRAFLDGSEALGFEAPRREAAYAFVHQQIGIGGREDRLATPLPHHRAYGGPYHGGSES